MELTGEKYNEIIRGNEMAMSVFEKTYGAIDKADVKHNIGDLSSYLRLIGLRCVKCALSRVSYQTLKFFGFVPEVICFNCQKINAPTSNFR